MCRYYCILIMLSICCELCCELIKLLIMNLIIPPSSTQRVVYNLHNFRRWESDNSNLGTFILTCMFLSYSNIAIRIKFHQIASCGNYFFYYISVYPLEYVLRVSYILQIFYVFSIMAQPVSALEYEASILRSIHSAGELKRCITWNNNTL